MVLADGKLITVNRDKNSDLFWACRGAGGGNFGVVTKFWYQVYPLKSVIIFDFTYRWSDAKRVTEVWQEWAPFTNNSLSSTVILKGPDRGIIVTGEWVGSRKKVGKAIL